jgi:hypothetical protein
MWKFATPAVVGLGFLALGAVGAQAQTAPFAAYAAPSVQPYTGPYGAPGPVCLNRTFGYGYGSPAYTAYCAPEGTWAGPWALRDPYSWYRPYSSNLGPKPST